MCISASSEPKIQAKGGGIQIKKPGMFGNSKTVINIQSAQNIQIGNNNTMVINSSGNRRRNRNVSPPPAAKPTRVDKERVKQVLGKYLTVVCPSLIRPLPPEATLLIRPDFRCTYIVE